MTTENKVTPEQITALMARVVFKSNVEGTSTFVHAYLDGSFYLATGHSACVDPANFNEKTGYDIARKNASLKAHDKLWELEGYALWKQLQDERIKQNMFSAYTSDYLKNIINTRFKAESIEIDGHWYKVSLIKDVLFSRGVDI